MITKKGFSKINYKKAFYKKALLLLLFFWLGLFINIGVYAAPSDENYDDNSDFISTMATTFDLNGISYTLTEVIGETIVTNDAISPLGNNEADYYMSFAADSIQIAAADGSAFKLNGFTMETSAKDGEVIIAPSSGSAIIRNNNYDMVTESIDLSGNTDFENITSFTISGNNLWLNIDDLDFSEPVLPAHTVTYNGNTNTSGSVPTDGSKYHTTDTVTVLGNTGSLVRTGYTFAGWNTAANGSGTSYTGGDTFDIDSNDVTLYAQWTAVDYTVSYDGNTNTGGSVPTDGNTYNITDTVTVLGNTGSIVKTGYTFAGWNTAANGSGTSYSEDDAFAMGSSNITLYAQWTENVYTVSYDGNSNTGGAVPTDGTSYNTTDTATVLGNTGSLVRTGYTFAGWNTAADGSGTSYNVGDTFVMDNNDVTLYAKWTTIEYAVTYDGNTNTSGSVPTDGSKYHTTDTVTVLGNTGSLFRTGYTFAGWNTAADGSGTSYNVGDTFVMDNNDVTLYAKWTTIEYAVTYDGNTNTSGSVPTDGSKYHTTDTVTVLGNIGSLVRTGYTFAGWNTAADGSGTSYNVGDTFVMDNNDVTLYAKWTTIEYAVTYDGNTNTSGSVPTDGSKYHTTDTVTVLGNIGSLVRTGYTFAGWNTAADGSGTSYNVGDTFVMDNNDVTLYAKWTTIEYAVTYDGNTNTSGSAPTDGSKYHTTDTVTVLGNTGSLVRTGYTFAGWNTAADGSGTSYNVGDTFVMDNNDVTLYAKWTTVEYAVTYDGNTNTSGSVPTDGTSYNTTDTVTVLGNTGSLVRTGYTFAGWNTAADGSGTSYNVGDTFVMDNNDVTLYAKWVLASNNGGGSSGSGRSRTITEPSQDPVLVIVNGEELNAGTKSKDTENGKTTVTVIVNNEGIERKIDTVINNNTTRTDNVIQIPVADKLSEIAKVELTGDIIKKLEENKFNISIRRDNVEYIIPAEEFTIGKVAENLGVIETDLVDIKVEVRITKVDEKVIETYNEVVKANGGELIFAPVSFGVMAKTIKEDGATGEVGINKFNNYVKRVMEMPVEVDPSKITTGIVFNSDGTYGHVPTLVYQKNGRWYASLNSLTNSNYSVIWNPISIKTVQNHWSKDAVNDMASRLVIFNTETFEPDKTITRADFAEYIVRALGLYREESKYVNKFSDVSTTGERTLAILIASENGIITGYPDGRFRPDARITREEAMTMYQRAMNLTKLEGTDDDRYQSYIDNKQVESWATSYVQGVLSAHVFNGTSPTTISPKSNLTYAEAAQAIKNLLVESQLINKE